MKANRITFDRIKKSPYKNPRLKRINIEQLRKNLKTLTYRAENIEKTSNKLSNKVIQFPTEVFDKVLRKKK